MKIRPRLAAVFLLFACLGTAFGLDKRDPAVAYLLQHSDPDGTLFGGEPWNGRLTTQPPTQPPGGYLFRFSVPVRGGQPIIFVTSSIYAELRQTTWACYRYSANGYYVLANPEVEFSNGGVPDLYWRTTPESQTQDLCAFWIHKASYGIASLQIGDGGTFDFTNVGGGFLENPDDDVPVHDR